MANPHRGEVAIKVGDKDYTLRLSINAIAEIENLLDLGVNEIAAKLGRPDKIRIGHLRAIVWGALNEHHPKMSVVDAGELIGEFGAPEMVGKIQEAFMLAFPQAADTEDRDPSR